MIFLIVIIFYDGIFLELDFSRDLILKDFDRRQWKIKFFLFFTSSRSRNSFRYPFPPPQSPYLT